MKEYNMKTHWVADMYPLNETDVSALAEDIKTNGQIAPIKMLKDGRIIREREAMNRGSVDRPLTAQDIITKYRDNAARQVSATRSLEIEERVLGLEKGSARDLATCLGRIA